MDLRTSQSEIAGYRVLAVEGTADMASLPRLHDAISRHLANHGTTPVAIDLDGVATLDDAALGLLLGAAARARSAGLGFVVVCSSPTVRRRLEETQLDQIVDVVESLTAP